jgi:hypothetical protein
MTIFGIFDALAIFYGKIDVSWFETIGVDGKEFNTILETYGKIKS